MKEYVVLRSLANPMEFSFTEKPEDLDVIDPLLYKVAGYYNHDTGEDEVITDPLGVKKTHSHYHHIRNILRRIDVFNMRDIKLTDERGKYENNEVPEVPEEGGDNGNIPD